MTFNIENLSDEQLDALEARLSAGQQQGFDSQPDQQQDLSQLSDDQLDQLERSLSAQQEPQQPQEMPENIQNLLQQQTLTSTPIDEFFRSLTEPAEGTIGRLGIRGIEEAGEIPGDAIQLLETLGVPTEALTSPVEQLTGFELPSSGQTREREQQVFGETLEAKGPVEEFAGDVTKDFVRLSATIGPIKGIPHMRALGTSFGGNLVKQGLIHGFDLDEGTADLAKIPIYMLSAGRGGVSKQEFTQNAWNNFESSIKGKVVTDPGLVQKLRNFSNKLQKGGLTEQQELVLKKVDDALKRLESGTFEFDELTEANKVINETYRNSKFDGAGRSLMGKYQEIIHDGVERWASPEQLKLWDEANLATKALGAHTGLVNAAKNTFKRTKLDPLTKAVITMTYPKALVAASTAGLLKNRVDLIGEIFRNPQARKFYLNALGGLITNQSAVAIKNAKSLDEFIKRSKGIGIKDIL